MAAETAIVAGASLAGATAGLAAAELTAAEASRRRCREMEMQTAMYAAAAASQPLYPGVTPYYPPPPPAAYPVSNQVENPPIQELRVFALGE